MFSSKFLHGITFCLAALLLLVGAFVLGVNIGERKTKHFSRWEDRYERTLRPSWRESDRRTGSRSPFAAFPDTHAAFGKILSVSANELIVQNRDDMEKTVLVTSSTAIRAGRGTRTMSDLRTDIDIAVFGTPNEQGQIEARLIRIFPPR